MNVFISYSVEDTELVRSVADRVKHKARASYWDQSKEPGKEVWPTIFSWIDAADLVLVLITDKTIGRAFSVGQEVGHAKKSGKQIIPLVAKSVPSTELGFLSGITYIPLDTGNPTAALQTLQAEVERLDREAKLRQLLEEQKKKEGIVVLAGLALLLFLLSKD
jgi:hypothetical protein